VEITLEYLKQKRQEYKQGYEQHLAIAQANSGAMEAIDELIALKTKEEGATSPPPLEESKE
jgi:hypothetical protein